jgi:predicted DNA-binding protein
MAVHLQPQTELRLQELSTRTGRTVDELVEDAMTGYLEELARVGAMLDARYDEIKSGNVKPIDGEAFFDELKRREQEMLKRRD